MRERRYPIVIERTATGFSAYSPDVPGCASAGDTEEETRGNFREALAAHFEAMREIGDPNWSRLSLGGSLSLSRFRGGVDDGVQRRNILQFGRIALERPNVGINILGLCVG